MKTKTFTISILALFFSASISFGQFFNKEKLDSLLNLLAEKNKAMGSLAISKNGNILYAKAIGYCLIDPQQKIASTEKTKYRIGSISKMFTATMIFQLIEEGKLELSTTLDKFFPTVPNAKLISIGNMLNHRSGIHSFTDDSTYLQWMTEPKTREEMIRVISEGKPDFEPGSKTAYSNSNFVLLGYIVEITCNKSYNAELQGRICLKIGLQDTYYGGKADVSKNESYSYSFIDGWKQQPETDMSVPHVAGAIVSTSADLVKFITALFNGQLISEKSLNKMKTITDGLGMGMQQFPYETRVIYGHGGAIDGFNSILCYFPDDSLAIAYCSNGTVYAVNDILLGALSIYYNKPYSLPVFTIYSVKPEDLEQYVGVYSSPQVPIKVTITTKDGVLYGQGTDQPTIPLEAIAKHVFKFEMAGIVMTFNPEKNEFLLEQGGGKYTFTKDK
jgi:CubicO group peptidase (beta-lactamase class C family)